MLDINNLRNDQNAREKLIKRAPDAPIDQIIKLDEQLKKDKQKNETLRSQRNVASDQIATLMKTDKSKAQEMIIQMKHLGTQIESGDKKIAKREMQLAGILSSLPNIPYDGVVFGGKEANKIVTTYGEKPKFNFTPKDHVTLCAELGLIDYERGTRMSGSGHWVYTGNGALLEWALLNYFVDFHMKNKYKFIMPPHILNYESGYAAGQFPRFMDDIFFVRAERGKGGAKFDPKTSKFLAPTSETALINMHRGETLQSENLPIKYFGYSPCYRGEPGGYGASERGTIRGHQFNKIEMFIFCNPWESGDMFNELVHNAEELIKGLGLHFTTVALAAGDMSSAMAKTYDTEVWLPSLSEYKEVSSISNATCFQARRANVRAKTTTHECTDGVCKKVNKTEFAHTLNASGLATSRLIPAIVEQFQNEDGSVNVPEVLHKYMHGITKLTK